MVKTLLKRKKVTEKKIFLDDFAILVLQYTIIEIKLGEVNFAAH